MSMADNILSDGEIALRILQGKTAEDKACFMVNWLRGTIVIPDDVMLRIWLMENGKRGLKPDMNSE